MKNALVLFCLLLISNTLRAQWVAQAVPFSQPTYFAASLQAVDASVAWAIAANPGGVFTTGSAGTQEYARTTDGGTTWETSTLPALTPHDTLTSLSAQSASTAWVTTTGSVRHQVLRTTDGGATWQPLLVLPASPDGRSLDYVHFFDASHGICLGNAGGATRFPVYTTADGGATWLENTAVPATTGAFDEYLAANARPVVLGADVWVPTTASRVFHSPDRGLSWTVREVAPGQQLGFDGPHLAFESATTGLALYSRLDGATSGAPLYRTTDGGATWQLAVFAGPLHGADVALVPGTRTYLSVGFDLPVAGLPSDAGSSYSRDGGATWQALESTQSHQLLSAAGPLAVWTSGYDFSTLRSTGVHKLTSTVLPTRVAGPVAGPDLQVYPQPSPDGRFRVQLPAGSTARQLQVRDGLGRLVSEPALPGPASSTCTVDLSGQPAGIYLLELRTAAGLTQARLVVQ